MFERSPGNDYTSLQPSQKKPLWRGFQGRFIKKTSRSAPMYPTLKAFLRAGVLAGSWDSNAHAELPGGRPWRTPRVGISAIFYYRGLLKKQKNVDLSPQGGHERGIWGGGCNNKLFAGDKEGPAGPPFDGRALCLRYLHTHFMRPNYQILAHVHANQPKNGVYQHQIGRSDRGFRWCVWSTCPPESNGTTNAPVAALGKRADGRNPQTAHKNTQKWCFYQKVTRKRPFSTLVLMADPP